MKKWHLVLGCAILASVALGLTFFRTSEEDQIKKTLEELVRIVAVKEGDTLISRAARLRSQLKDVVADDVRVDVSELGLDVRGRQKLADDATKAGLMFQRADCALVHLSIKVDPGGTVATADGVALVTAVRGGERRGDERDVHFLLRKDGAWKVSTIDVAAPKQN